jgi:predicted neuraminidase
MMMVKKLVGVLLLAVPVSAIAQTATMVTSSLIMEQPPFPASHASSLVELPGNQLMAAWFSGPHESSPLVTIWLSTWQKGKWSTPVEIADGVVNNSLRYACWNPVLFRTHEGRLFLFYKVGKSPRDWWGMMKYSDNEGRTWSAAEKLPDSFLGPIKNKPVQLKDGTILYPSSTESADEKEWHIHMEKSDSKGQHWKLITINCDTFGVIQPSILSYKNNKLQLLCRSRQNHIVQSWSSDNGNTWSPLAKTALPNPNSGSDAVTLRNGLQVLVYNPLPKGAEWYNGRNKLVIAVSANGIDWKDVYTLEDAPDGEYSYPAIKIGRAHV